MPTVQETFSDTSQLAELLQSELHAGALRTAAAYTVSRTTTGDLLASEASSAAQSLGYTLAKRPGGSGLRLQFSADGSAWRSASGDDLTGRGAYSYDQLNDSIAFGAIGTVKSLLVRLKPSSTAAQKVLQLSASVHVEINSSGQIAGVGWTSPSYYHGAIAGARQVHTRWQLIALTSATSVDATDFILGKAGTGYFGGAIGEVWAYSRQLTAAEIAALELDGTEPDSSALVGRWHFDGDATDASGNGHHGTVQGATAMSDWRELPQLGVALGAREVRAFDGVDDRIDIGDADAFSFTNGAADLPFSLSAWVFREASSCPIIGKTSLGASAGADNEWLLWFGPNGELGLHLYDDSGNNQIRRISNGTLDGDLHQWHHYACTYDGSGSAAGLKLYRDGAEIPSAGSTVGTYLRMRNTAGQVRVGASFLGSSFAAHARMRVAGVAVWSDVRTAAEIEAEYGQGYVDLGDANLIECWPLGESAGSTAFGERGAHHGTYSGPAAVQEAFRPAPRQPTEQTLSLAALALTDSFYYRLLLQSPAAGTSPSLDEVVVAFQRAGVPLPLLLQSGVVL